MTRTAAVKARYDRHAATYDKRTAMMERLAFGRLRRRVWTMIQGPRVLEVGVGTGMNMPFYPQGVEVIGIDLSDKMLAEAKRRAAGHGIAVTLLEMDVQSMEFPTNKFDAAVSTCVFCSVPDPLRGLSEVERVLKPGGRLFMIEHVRGPGILGPIFDLLNPLVVRMMGSNINRDTVANVLRAGFEIEHLESHALSIVKLIVARKDSAK